MRYTATTAEPKVFFAARCYASAAYVIMRCLSVCLFVCHVRELFQNE